MSGDLQVEPTPSTSQSAPHSASTDHVHDALSTPYEDPLLASAGIVPTTANSTPAIAPSSSTSLGTYPAKSEIWDRASSAGMGAFVDTLVPGLGDRASAKLDLDIPIAGINVGIAHATGSIAFRMGVNAARDDKGVRLSGELSVSPRLSAGVKSVLKAFVEAGVVGTIEVQGDSATECFELLRWHCYESLIATDHPLAQQLALALFDHGHTLDTVGELDANDHIEAATGFSARAGLRIGKGKNKAVDGEIGFQNLNTSTVGRDEEGTFHRSEGREVHFDLKTDVFRALLEIDGHIAFDQDDVKTGGGVRVRAGFQIPAEQISAELEYVDYFASMASEIFDASNMVATRDASAGRVLGSMGDMLATMTPADVEAPLRKGIEQLAGNKVMSSVAMVFEFEDTGGGTRFSFSVERGTSVGWNAPDAFPVGLEVSGERIDELFRLTHESSGPAHPTLGVWAGFDPNTRGGFAARALHAAGSSVDVNELLNGGRLAEPATRAEAAAIALRAINGSAVLPQGKTAYFADVYPDAWYFTEVHAARRYGVFTGHADNTMRPLDMLSPAGAKVVLDRITSAGSPLPLDAQGDAPHLLDPATAQSAQGDDPVFDQVIGLPSSKRAALFREIARNVTYKNQRNNAGVGTSGDYMCNMTTMAMLFEQLGVKVDPRGRQLEDFLDQHMQSLHGNPADTIGNPRYSRVARETFAEQEYGVTVDEIPGCGAAGAQGAAAWFAENVLPHLENGAGASLGIGKSAVYPYLHIVRLEWVEPQGLCVDDPFGQLLDLGGTYDYRFNSKTSEGDEGARGEDNIWGWDMVGDLDIAYVQLFSRKVGVRV